MPQQTPDLTITFPLETVTQLPADSVNGTFYEVKPIDSTVQAGLFYKSETNSAPIYLGPRPKPH